jgi:two-component system, NtrC family, sensor kinase
MAYEYDSDTAVQEMSREELKQKVRALTLRARKLEDLVEIISRGKYMWESTFDAITAPVQIVSAEYEILRANLKFAAVCGKDIGAIIGRKCYDVFAKRDRPCDGCPLAEALSKDARTRAPLRNVISRLEFEANAYPLGTGAVPDSAVLSYRDITEERRLHRELVQQEKMAAIGVLAGGVAHEINNPLGGILAFTQLMKRDALGNGTLIADLEEVERAAIRCKKIVADLLEFSRVTRESDRLPVDINILLEKIFPFVQCEIRSYNVELDFRASSPLPRVLANPDRLQQVFINLMTNACHAMPKGGTLTVETREEGKGEWIVVSVADTGVGIPAEIREHIFEPFFTTKAPGGGTGLGLSISYRIIRDHGGEISCESTEGEGTTFTVRLPAAEAED